MPIEPSTIPIFILVIPESLNEGGCTGELHLAHLKSTPYCLLMIWS